METLTLDRHKLIGEVAAKLGVLLSEDDPIFATVILNEMVLNRFITTASNEMAQMIALTQLVRNSINDSTIKSTSKIDAQVDKLLLSIDQLRKEAAELDQFRIKNLEAAAKSSAEFAIQDSYKRVSELLDPVITNIRSEVQVSINQLNESFIYAKELHTESALSINANFQRTILKLNSEKNRTLVLCISGGCFGSLIGSFLVRFFH